MATETVEETSVLSSHPVELELFVGDGYLTHKRHRRHGCFLGYFARWRLEFTSSGRSGPSIPGGREPSRYFVRSSVFLDNCEPLCG